MVRSRGPRFRSAPTHPLPVLRRPRPGASGDLMPWRFGWLGWCAVGLAGLAAVLGLATGLVLEPGPVDRLRDDAYYEFALAANVAAGLGPTVSDGVTTSGVQWLWSLLLVPLAWACGPALLPTLAPWLGCACHVAAGWLWWRSTTDRRLGACLALLWLGNPLLVRECQNGQETALASLCLTWLWRERAAREGRFLLAAALCVAARADLFGAVLCLSGARHWQALVRGLVTPAMVLSAWAVANCACGGGLLPDSAAPMPWLWHTNFAATAPDWRAELRQWWWFFRPALAGGPFALASLGGFAVAGFALVRPWWPRGLRALPAFAVGCAHWLGARDLGVPGTAALLLALWPARRRTRLDRPLLWFVLGTSALVLLHWALRWYPRDYYAAALVPAAMAAVASFGRARWLLVVVAAAQLLSLAWLVPEPLAGQRALQLAGERLAAFVPAGDRVGSFNSGLLTMHAAVLRRGTAEQRGVVNLDGVVDARSFAALRRGQLDAWLDAEGIRFLLDAPRQFAADPRLAHANGQHFGAGFQAERDLVECARFVVFGDDLATGPFPDCRLYWRRGRGVPPGPALGAQDLGPAPRGRRALLWPARAGATLLVERAAGVLVPLLAVDADTAVVLELQETALGTGRLFELGQAEPVLVLPRL